MMRSFLQLGDKVLVERPHFERLLDALGQRGYRVVGPTVQDGAIVYGELTSAADLPVGWTDEQEGGAYRLKRRTDEALFGYVVGPHSWKKFLHPPVLRLWQARREGRAFQMVPESEAPPKFAFIGVRACELHAVAIQDKVFMNGTYVDPTYKARRQQAFIIAVNIQTLGEGEILGWSWLIPPYRWHFDARAVELTRAIALDGKCLRTKCEEDHDLGYELLKRFAYVIGQRLQATRLQLLDIYAVHS